ncbi:MAG: hypothetical protein HZA49_10485 [Planctomycetes bacterium]|nr:hypothetical protein [Planctomycetota bacterium]
MNTTVTATAKTRKHADGMTKALPDKNCRDKSQYVAGASTGSKEFIEEQLYQPALAGAFQQEFNFVKACIPELKPYQTPADFMRAMWRDKSLCEKLVRLLEALWKSDFARRPALGLVLMLALRRKNVMAGDDYWGDYFIGLAEGKDGVPCEE